MYDLPNKLSASNFTNYYNSPHISIHRLIYTSFFAFFCCNINFGLVKREFFVGRSWRKILAGDAFGIWIVGINTFYIVLLQFVCIMTAFTRANHHAHALVLESLYRLSILSPWTLPTHALTHILPPSPSAPLSPLQTPPQPTASKPTQSPVPNITHSSSP